MKTELFNKYLMWIIILRCIDFTAIALWFGAVWMICKPWHSLPALIWWLSVCLAVVSIVIIRMSVHPVNRKRSVSPRARLADAGFVLYIVVGTFIIFLFK